MEAEVRVMQVHEPRNVAYETEKKSSLQKQKKGKEMDSPLWLLEDTQSC